MMKNLITKTLALCSIMLLALVSCKKDGDVVSVGTTGNTASVLTASTTTPNLTKATLTATSVSFSGTAPSYGYSAAITNTLQFDLHSDNFATPSKIKDVTLPVGALTQSYNVKDFNNVLLGMGLATGVSVQVDVRVKSSLSTTAGIIYSNVVTLTVTPFALVSYIYVPGAYQGWNPATADSLQSALGNGIYTGIINYVGTDYHFKITTAKNWNVAYGDAGSGKVSTSGGDISAPGPGLYQVTVDLNTNTITMSPPTHFYSIIGDAAIDWGTDLDMKFNNGTQLWTLTTALKSSGGFKFRQDHKWDFSWGLPTPVNGGNLTSSSGGNITVSANGTYALTFGNVPVDNSTATYTAVKQ